MKTGRNNENGYIVVETVGAFIPFLLLVVSILSLVNIVAVQARVHYALTQAANTLSMYCYTLELLGVANDLTELDGKAYRAKTDVDEIIDSISSVITVFESSSVAEELGEKTEALDRAIGAGENLFDDPLAVMKNMMCYGIDNLWDMLFSAMVRPLVGRYLSNGELTGNGYLLRSGVVNTHTKKEGLAALEFFFHADKKLENSSLIDRNGNVKLVVEYEIEYTFWGLKLPFRPTLRIAQTVVTKAWLNGSGKGYK